MRKIGSVLCGLLLLFQPVVALAQEAVVPSYEEDAFVHDAGILRLPAEAVGVAWIA